MPTPEDDIVEQYDETYKQNYFLNRSTGKSAWTREEVVTLNAAAAEPVVNNTKFDLDDHVALAPVKPVVEDLSKYEREGYLAKKTTKGKWNQRYFHVNATHLSYFKSDNKTPVDMKLGPGVNVVDVKFGTKKFVFKVEAEHVILSLACSGEAEKQHWIESIEIFCGSRKSAAADSSSKGGIHLQVHKMDKGKIAGLAGALGLDLPGNAAESLARKLHGKGVALPMPGVTVHAMPGMAPVQYSARDG
jgi:hypothetical protein